MSWAIICDAREDANGCVDVLALVNRSITKDCWWTSDSSLSIMRFRSKEAAQARCGQFAYNNTRVVCYEKAVARINSQAQCLMLNFPLEEELGWDAHKGTF